LQGPALRDPSEPPGPRAAEPAGAGAPLIPQRTSEDDQRRGLVDQLVASVRASAGGTIEIRLAPEELGQVRLDIRLTDGGLSVLIDAERSESLDLMRRNADLLARELRDAGFGAINLAFGSGTPQRDDRPGARAAYAERDGAPAPLPPETAARRAHASARLDLRL
jgi:hypothetical protein